MLEDLDYKRHTGEHRSETQFPRRSSRFHTRTDAVTHSLLLQQAAQESRKRETVVRVRPCVVGCRRLRNTTCISAALCRQTPLNNVQWKMADVALSLFLFDRGRTPTGSMSFIASCVKVIPERKKTLLFLKSGGETPVHYTVFLKGNQPHLAIGVRKLSQ